MYISLLIQTLSITVPVVLLVVLGVYLRHKQHIDDAFVATSSRLVFNVSLPVLMFLAIVTADMAVSQHLPLVWFSLGASLAAFAFVFAVSKVLRVSPRRHGAFVQGAFRSNLGIVGLALCLNAYPEEGAILGALILAVVTPVYNLLSVWVLASGDRDISWGQQLMTTARNPLIIAIALAGVVRSLGLELPQVLLQTGDILAGLTLPLALIGIGASLTMSRALVADSVVWSAVALKLVVLPTLIIVSAVYIGITGAALGVIALMFASPTAAAAFVMAKSMNADSRLTADVIALSTLGSGVTVTTIIYVLNLSGLL